MTATTVSLTLYYVVVRPYTARLEVAVVAAQSGTLAALCGLTLGAVASGGAAVSAETLETAGLAAEAVSFGAPVALLVPVAWKWICGCGRGNNGKDAATATVPAEGGAVSASLLTVPRRVADVDRAAPHRAVASRKRAGDRERDVVVEAAGARRNNPLVSANGR
jgi:hypothetical protein